MATPPVTFKSNSSISLTTSPARKAFDLRSYAIHQIGQESFKGFEMWAFQAQETIIYDERIVWLWNNTHNKDPLTPGNTRDCLDSMIVIWKSRFAEWPPTDFSD